MENRKHKAMTAQIFLTIYIITIVCSFGGLSLLEWDIYHTLRLKLDPNPLIFVLYSIIPIFNIVIAYNIAARYDEIKNNIIRRIKENE